MLDRVLQHDSKTPNEQYSTEYSSMILMGQSGDFCLSKFIHLNNNFKLIEVILHPTQNLEQHWFLAHRGDSKLTKMLLGHLKTCHQSHQLGSGWPPALVCLADAFPCPKRRRRR